MTKPLYIFVHHTAVSYAKNPDQWKATDRYHAGKGWGGGGYNAEVSKSGSVHTFREDGEQTVAQFFAKPTTQFPKDQQKSVHFLNKNALSICFDGNFDVELPTDEQCEAVYNWIQAKMAKHGIPRERIFAHRSVSPKSCWGRLLPDDVLGYLESRLHNPNVPEYGKIAWQKAIQKGLVDGKTNPMERVGNDRDEEILFKLGGLSQKEGYLTEVRRMVAYDRLKLLD